MKAKFIFENYPPGAANDRNAPWNQCDDHSYVDFEMDKDGDPRLITKACVGEDDIEILENRSIDPMYLDRALLKKLGLSYDELENLNMEEEFYIEEYYQKKDTVYFKTTAGDTQLSISELQSL
jgi:hypothetical protein